jgi:hypothetical protein
MPFIGIKTHTCILNSFQRGSYNYDKLAWCRLVVFESCFPRSIVGQEETASYLPNDNGMPECSTER